MTLLFSFVHPSCELLSQLKCEVHVQSLHKREVPRAGGVERDRQLDVLGQETTELTLQLLVEVVSEAVVQHSLGVPTGDCLDCLPQLGALGEAPLDQCSEVGHGDEQLVGGGVLREGQGAALQQDARGRGHGGGARGGALAAVCCTQRGEQGGEE